MKVAFDTNVLMSAIGTRGLCADLLRVVLRDHELVVGEQVLGELRRNLVKKWRLSEDVADEYCAFLRRQSGEIAHAERAPIEGLTRADAQVLADAAAGGATVFVTGDGELLALAARAPVPILSPRQFWERLRSQ